MNSTESSLLSRLREWLAADGISPSGRLPAERALAEKFVVSRSELRKALGVLERDGEITRHVGRGTFLQRRVDAGTLSAREIAHATSPTEAMQARLVLEPQLAQLAALHATPHQIAGLWSLTRLARTAESWAEYEECDFRFHRLLAQATRNTLLASVLEVVNEVRRTVVWGRLQRRPDGPPANYHSFDEHEAIASAVEQRDRERAAAAMRKHLLATAAQLVGGLPMLDE